MIKEHTISEAAKLLGCHPETLRNYERRGIVSPKRDLWGWRRYSQADIDKIRGILHARWNETGKPAVGERKMLISQDEI